MQYFNSMKTDKFVSKFAYIFLAIFAFTALACESDNDDNPLASSFMAGYISDSNYWHSIAPSVVSSGRDSLGNDTILTINASSLIDQSTISIFVPYPTTGSFSVGSADSSDTPVTTISYNGAVVPSGTVNITRFSKAPYILEANFSFSYEGVVQSDSGAVTTDIQFTKGTIKSSYLRR